MRSVMMLVAMLIAACGGDAPSAPSVPSPEKTYVLASLLYEDVLPGKYHVVATDATLEGGPAAWVFRDDQTGTLSVASGMSVLFVDTLSGTSQRAPILSAGQYAFSYQLDSLGAPTFNRNQPWPFTLPTVVTDSVVRQEARTCYDEACTDRTVLTVGWVRQ